MTGPSIISPGITSLPVQKVSADHRFDTHDLIVVEEPLEIILEYGPAGKRIEQSVSVTMRTPGHDLELALGFLFTEGILPDNAVIPASATASAEATVTAATTAAALTTAAASAAATAAATAATTAPAATTPTATTATATTATATTATAAAGAAPRTPAATTAAATTAAAPTAPAPTTAPAATATAATAATPTNTIRVALHPGIIPDLKKLQRHFYTSSSCGVCGKISIESLYSVRPAHYRQAPLTINAGILYHLPYLLREGQNLFDSTGGLHAAGLFDRHGHLLAVREDIGRHNALDKLIGHALQQNNLPLSAHILVLSGRACFELIQKATMAGFPIVAAVGPPSSLAVQLAQESGITLVGFLKTQRFNIYAGAQRIQV